VLAKVNSFILLGIDAQLCEVEVDASQHGMEKTVVVGLAQAAVKESLERVARAIINSGYPYLAHHLLVNLAPADVKKEATAVDLPIAVGILRATNCINTDQHRKFLIAGELALDGRVRKIKGGLSLALLAREKKYRGAARHEAR
jgi:magnesium chelatase family protein